MLMCAGSAVSQQRGAQAESPGVGSTESRENGAGRQRWGRWTGEKRVNLRSECTAEADGSG